MATIVRSFHILTQSHSRSENFDIVRGFCVVLSSKILSFSATFGDIRCLYDSSSLPCYIQSFVHNMFRPQTAIIRYINYISYSLYFGHINKTFINFYTY
jgi:hypothetical protein